MKIALLASASALILAACSSTPATRSGAATGAGATAATTA